jgi:hypothetical protein
VSVARNVVAVAAGSSHSLFVTSDGTLWAMGYNGYGQLGNGTTVSTNVPVSVASNVVAVAAGWSHSLFVTSNNTLWAMGYNYYGQLGNGATGNTNVPVSVASNVVAVAAGNVHSLFVTSNGTLWAMGYNNRGQLGNGTTVISTSVPVPIPGLIVASLGGMEVAYHSLAVAGMLPQLSGPVGGTILAGQPWTFSVTITNGDGPFSYQWCLDDSPISGATSSTYYLPSMSTSQAGSYTVVVSNAYGSVTSAAASLSVILPPAGMGTGVSRNPDGSMTVSFVGALGAAYWVQATTNVVSGTWVTLGTNTPGDDGTWSFTDLEASNYPLRFYRTSKP